MKIPYELIDIVLKQTGNSKHVIPFEKILSRSTIKYLYKNVFITTEPRQYNIKMVKINHYLGYSYTYDNMYKACEFNHLDIVKFFHSIGIKDNQVYNNKYEMVSVSSRLGNIEMLKYIIDIGYKWSSTAMNWASQFGHLEVVKLLHSYGCKCTHIAMDFSSRNGHTEVVKFLHSIGAKYSPFALDYSYRNNHKEITEFLVSIGAKGSEEILRGEFYNGYLHGYKYKMNYLDREYPYDS
jgi:hypothetical protein